MYIFENFKTIHGKIKFIYTLKLIVGKVEK